MAVSISDTNKNTPDVSEVFTLTKSACTCLLAPQYKGQMLGVFG